MKLLAKKNNIINQVQHKLKLFKSSNQFKQKLTLLNEISNELCQIIDTANILYSSKLYVQQRPLFQQINENIQYQFNLLNTDAQIYNQTLDMYYLLDHQQQIDIDESEGQSERAEDFLKRFKKQIKNHQQQNELDKEDIQFLKMFIFDYETRYFINKAEGDVEKLSGLQMIESHLLQTLRQQQAKSCKRLELNMNQFRAFEVPPDAYIHCMSTQNRSANQMALDLPSQMQAYLIKNCLDPKLRLQLFNDFLDTNKSSEPLLSQLMEVRDQFANKLGFQDFQQYQFALNSKFFHSTRTDTQIQQLQTIQKSESVINQSEKNSSLLSGDINYQQRDIKITIQRILNTSVERCQKKLDTLFAETQFYTSLLQNSHYPTPKSPQEQHQLQYSDLIYLRQKILATPLYKFTLQWEQAFALLNQITSRYLDVEFKECLPPHNHFYNRVCDIKSEDVNNSREVHPSDQFKGKSSTNQSTEDKVFEKNMKCFEVIQKQENGQGQTKGIVYIDFNAYEDAKTCFSSGYCEINKFKQLPCLLIRMNFKVLDNKSELTFDNFQTLMHEVGHSLHSVLNHHRYQLLGNNYKIDYAEICAKVFENLVFLLPQAQYSKIPGVDFLFQKPFTQYMELFRIMSQLEQVYYAKLDLFMHEKHPSNSLSLKEFSSLIQKNIFKSLISNNDNYWFCNLSHLEEYSGMYFSYAVGEEIFYELQDKQESFPEQKSFIQDLFTTAHQ